MRNVILTPLRLSLFAAMGVAASAACGGNVTYNEPGSGPGTGPGSGGSTSSNATSTGSGNGPSSACVNPQPIIATDGSDSGFVRCADGAIDRPQANRCDVTVHMPACDASAQSFACMSDAECADAPNGRCVIYTSQNFGGDTVTSCGCAYPCSNDADCGPGSVCVCHGVAETPINSPWAAPPGHAFCAPASCQTDDACASAECGLSSYWNGCNTEYGLGCRTPNDTCRVSAQCSGAQCALGAGPAGWQCSVENCAIGRPLMVAGQPRTAPLIAGQSWRASLDPTLADLDERTRAALAAHWGEVAGMEHASVASFARFILQLLGIGAPAELVRDAQRAMADEIDHAEMAYALAGAYAGRALGPGPMSLKDAAVATDLGSVLVALAEEACVGETLGVAEAMAAALDVEDPVLRGVLTRIADDELRHAQLAWRTLRWGLVHADESTRARVEEAIRVAMRRLAVDPVADRPASPRHGLLSAVQIGAVRRQALREVVEPCAREALRRPLQADSALA